MSGRERPDGINPELWAWHLGALDGDPAVCGTSQPSRPGYPCIWNTNAHAEHRDVHGRTWPTRQAEKPLHVAHRPADAAQVLLAMNLRLQDLILDRTHPWVVDGQPTHWQAVQHLDGVVVRLTAYIGPADEPTV
ncbi:hypothetical protein JBE04_08315 [Streptomyces sp. PRKS01-29]|nr:hypothetical protein [Streptomyces sabulosicollis]MBI0294485.1 hypothetical protein [Streptomyces sabulosicollis]